MKRLILVFFNESTLNSRIHYSNNSSLHFNNNCFIEITYVTEGFKKQITWIPLLVEWIVPYNIFLNLFRAVA